MGYPGYARNGACALPSPSPFHYVMANIVPAMQLAAKRSTSYGRSYGAKSKFFRLDGLLLFCIIMGLSCTPCELRYNCKWTIVKVQNITRMHASRIPVLIVLRKSIEAIATSLHLPSLNEQATQQQETENVKLTWNGSTLTKMFKCFLGNNIPQVRRPPKSATSSRDRYGNTWWSRLRIWLQELWRFNNSIISSWDNNGNTWQNWPANPATEAKIQLLLFAPKDPFGESFSKIIFRIY